MPTAAIYARVSSARQKEQQTIQSQTAALLAHAAKLGLDVPAEWVFEDDGCSGATLVRPALERLRDLVCQVPVEVVLCYAPDRLARKYAYQALLVEELARAGTEVCFVNGPTGDRPEDALLVQFQGMIAEYEKAQIIERTRRGKAHRAKQGSVNVLSGAPYGYRYVRKSDHAEARYEFLEPEASVVRELFGRYTHDGCSIADLARWLSDQQIPTRTGKARWDRSTVWGMLRNPAYAGRAAFSKTVRTDQQARLTRPARLAGRSISTNPLIADRPRQDWVEIAVPAIVSEETFQLAARRLADNQRFAARNTKVPSLLQGLAACQRCGYAYYRTSTRTSARTLYYYRCLGSDDYRYPGGRVCANLPVRADYLDQVVWDHMTRLLADPALVRGELDRRLAELRAANPATATKARLEREQTRTATAISRLVEAYQEQLLSLDELRGRMPALRAKQHTLRAQLDALQAQLVDQQATLALAENLEGFLGRLRDTATTASVPERQRVLRLLVKEVLIGPERVVVRHRIPVTSPEPTPGYLLRGRSPLAPAGQHRLERARRARDGAVAARRVDGDRLSASCTSEEGHADLADRPLLRRFRRARAWPAVRRRSPARGRRRCARPARTALVADQDAGSAHERWVRLPGAPHPVAPQAGHEPVVRLHLHRRPAPQSSEGKDPCHDSQGVAGRPQDHPDQDQSDLARMGELLSARSVQAHAQPPAVLRQLADHPVTEETAPLALGAVPPTLHHRLWAVAIVVDERDQTVQPRIGDRHSLPIPGHDPHPLGEGEPRLTAETVESPVRREAHAGFGERHGETDRQQCRHRAPCRLNQRLVQRRRPRPVGSRLTMVRYRCLSAACSLGKCPRALTERRKRALRLSMALVVAMTVRISRSKAKKGTNSAQACSHSRTIAG
jgi:site-specific DNA recombinase